MEGFELDLEILDDYICTFIQFIIYEICLQAWALYYLCDITLSQEFSPMGAQLSLKTVLQMAEILATASNLCNNTGPGSHFC